MNTRLQQLMGAVFDQSLCCENVRMFLHSVQNYILFHVNVIILVTLLVLLNRLKFIRHSSYVSRLSPPIAIYQGSIKHYLLYGDFLL